MILPGSGSRLSFSGSNPGSRFPALTILIFAVPAPRLALRSRFLGRIFLLEWTEFDLVK